MRVYVASKFENRLEVRRAQKMLRDQGIEITFDWTWAPEMLEGIDPKSKVYETMQGEMARLDQYGVESADAMLLIGHPGMRGAFVEFGIALARRIPLYIVNREHVEQIFLYNDNVAGFYISIDDGVAALVSWVAAQKAAMMQQYLPFSTRTP